MQQTQTEQQSAPAGASVRLGLHATLTVGDAPRPIPRKIPLQTQASHQPCTSLQRGQSRRLTRVRSGRLHQVQHERMSEHLLDPLCRTATSQHVSSLKPRRYALPPVHHIPSAPTSTALTDERVLSVGDEHVVPPSGGGGSEGRGHDAQGLVGSGFHSGKRCSGAGAPP